MLREARLILPIRDNDGFGLALVKRALEVELAERFGGFTLITSGRGGWMNGENSFSRNATTETVWIFDVAVEDDPLQPELFAIARKLKIDARQDAIYLRLPSGVVHFV